mmetsp:Transcript_50433/g.119921  ORF Transcript_50433/g.119921 Transcript_50433/m.119921 type:complete len:983 (-) Transcript_50433:80-3028(-)
MTSSDQPDGGKRLFKAVIQDDVATVEQLIAEGVDWANIRNNAGETPLEVAKQRKRIKVLQHLRKLNAEALTKPSPPPPLPAPVVQTPAPPPPPTPAPSSEVETPVAPQEEPQQAEESAAPAEPASPAPPEDLPPEHLEARVSADSPDDEEKDQQAADTPAQATAPETFQEAAVPVEPSTDDASEEQPHSDFPSEAAIDEGASGAVADADGSAADEPAQEFAGERDGKQIMDQLLSEYLDLKRQNEALQVEKQKLLQNNTPSSSLPKAAAKKTGLMASMRKKAEEMKLSKTTMGKKGDPDAEEVRHLKNELEDVKVQVKSTHQSIETYKAITVEAEKNLAVPASQLTQCLYAMLEPSAKDVRVGLPEAEAAATAHISDSVMAFVGKLVLTIARDHNRGEGNDTTPQLPEEERLALQNKLDEQQEELDRLLEGFHESNERIARLRSEVEEQVETKKGKEPESHKLAREKVREVDARVNGLKSKLQMTEVAMKEVEDLRTQLRTTSEQLKERRSTLEELKIGQEARDDAHSELRERVALAQEDAACRELERVNWNPLQEQLPEKASETASLAAEAFVAADALGTEDDIVASFFAAKPAGSDVAQDADELDEGPDVVDAAIQVDLGLGLDMGKAIPWETQMEDINIEMVLLKKRTARELQDLQALLQEQERELRERGIDPADMESHFVRETDPIDEEVVAVQDNTQCVEESNPSEEEEEVAVEEEPLTTEVAKATAGEASQHRRKSCPGPSTSTDMEAELVVTRCQSSPAVVDAISDTEGTDHSLKPTPPPQSPPKPPRLSAQPQVFTMCSEDSMKSFGRQAEEGIEPYPAGLLYVQRVDELEDRTESLRIDLKRMHEIEQSLRVQSREKSDLIAYLMKKARNRDDDATPKRRLQVCEQDIDELEMIIEETLQDNVRLRDDVQNMSRELRRWLDPTTGLPSLAAAPMELPLLQTAVKGGPSLNGSGAGRSPAPPPPPPPPPRPPSS